MPTSAPTAEPAIQRAASRRDPALEIVATEGFTDYALLDSGAGRKLERFGPVVVDRPESQAMWHPALPPADWKTAHAVFSASGEDDEKGRWRLDRPVPDEWRVTVREVTMLCRLKGLWHLGLFPEQLPHWEWMLSRVAETRGVERPRVLNLFGYTGAATLLAAAAGAEVTHVDASKAAIAWARDNQAASGLASAPVRWIVDDAAKFVARDVRRGKVYDMILVDPPKYGRGPDGEVWELFAGLPNLLADCARLLAPERASLVLTAYAIRASALALDALVADVLTGRTGTIQSGELAIRERSAGRLLPTSLFTRWSGA